MANPIQSVNGVAVRCPSSYQYDLQDISAADAGRTEDTNMDKMRIGQCVKIELAWNGIRTSDVGAILRAFNPEYITVTYLDPLAGGYRTSEFYVGDRSAPMYSSLTNLWNNLTFNIIERRGVER